MIQQQKSLKIFEKKSDKMKRVRMVAGFNNSVQKFYREPETELTIWN